MANPGAGEPTKPCGKCNDTDTDVLQPHFWTRLPGFTLIGYILLLHLKVTWVSFSLHLSTLCTIAVAANFANEKKLIWPQTQVFCGHFSRQVELQNFSLVQSVQILGNIVRKVCFLDWENEKKCQSIQNTSIEVFYCLKKGSVMSPIFFWGVWMFKNRRLLIFDVGHTLNCQRDTRLFWSYNGKLPYAHTNFIAICPLSWSCAFLCKIPLK